jgi:hypothetical protein
MSGIARPETKTSWIAINKLVMHPIKNPYRIKGGRKDV